jgi:hypothetical protein
MVSARAGIALTAVVLGGVVAPGGAARSAYAQEPSTPPPPAGGGGHAGGRYHELLPDIGRIGAQVGAAAGPSWNPYGAGSGWQVAGFIDLPLARNRAGRLSYEIVLALSAGESARTRLRLLDVSPFALKYTLTGLDHARLRPYVTGGVDVLLAVTDEGGEREDPVPAGEASLALGGHAGAGIELRVSRGLSVNVDYRFTRFEGARSLHAASAALGIHW